MSVKQTVQATRSTSGDGTAVIAAPGTGKYIHIYDGAAVQAAPGDDDCTVTIKSGSDALFKVALSGGVYGVVGMPEMVAGENEDVFVNLSATADVDVTISYAVRSIISVPHDTSAAGRR